MNVYDFDNTILRGDSSVRFFFYCLRHFPRMWADIPGQALNGAQFLLRLKPKQAFKQRMFAYLTRIGDVDAAVDAFWKANLSRIKAWYPPLHREDDVVISASPEFLLRPAAERLGVSLIATPMDPYSGRILGRNCHDEEKLRRFRAEYPDSDIDCFYSDSLSDAPLASIAAHAILVKGDRLLPWPQ